MVLSVPEARGSSNDLVFHAPPTPAADLDSISYEITSQKLGESLANYIDEKLEVKTSRYFRSYFATKGFAKLLKFYLTNKGRPLSNPHSP